MLNKKDGYIWNAIIEGYKRCILHSLSVQEHVLPLNYGYILCYSIFTFPYFPFNILPSLPEPPPPSPQSGGEGSVAAVQENKENLKQREQFYATVRKTSPHRDPTQVDRIPGEWWSEGGNVQIGVVWSVLGGEEVRSRYYNEWIVDKIQSIRIENVLIFF